MILQKSIEVKKSPVGGKGGLGVFATADIQKGEVVEVAPILVLQFEDFIDTRWNLLFDYYFWLDDYVVLALGYGSLYNHSDTANLKYQVNLKDHTITFTATINIKKGEELFFNYRGDTEQSTLVTKTPLWFERE